MFFCEKCRVKNQWPTLLPWETSYGPCEDCGTTGPCYDTPSHMLPAKKPHKTTAGGTDG